jgi:hypothetical protein
LRTRRCASTPINPDTILPPSGVDWSAPGRSGTLSISGLHSPGPLQAIIRIVTVPEPTLVAALAVALGLVFAARRKDAPDSVLSARP